MLTVILQAIVLYNIVYFILKKYTKLDNLIQCIVSFASVLLIDMYFLPLDGYYLTIALNTCLYITLIYHIVYRLYMWSKRMAEKSIEQVKGKLKGSELKIKNGGIIDTKKTT